MFLLFDLNWATVCPLPGVAHEIVLPWLPSITDLMSYQFRSSDCALRFVAFILHLQSFPIWEAAMWHDTSQFGWATRPETLCIVPLPCFFSLGYRYCSMSLSAPPVRGLLLFAFVLGLALTVLGALEPSYVPHVGARHSPMGVRRLFLSILLPTSLDIFCGAEGAYLIS